MYTGELACKNSTKNGEKKNERGRMDTEYTVKKR